MDTDENALHGRISQLRQPSKIPSPGQGLFEMSASVENARSSGSSMAPPEKISLKHKGSALPEPAPKRKTLIERAGEPARSNVVAPSHVRPPSSASVRGTSSSCSRNPSLLSATSLQTPSVTATSAVSNGVSSSKSGSESQAASARAKHPKTTEVGLPQTAKKPSRPASSLDNHTAATDKPALGKRKAWDTKGRLEDMEYLYSELKQKMDGTVVERNGLEEAVDLYKSRINELEATRAGLAATNASLQAQLDGTRTQLTTTLATLEGERRTHHMELDNSTRQHHYETDQAERRARDELDAAQRSHRDELKDVKIRLESEIDDERSRRLKEMQELSTQSALERQKAQVEMDVREREMRNLKHDLEQAQGGLSREQALNRSLRDKIAEMSSNVLVLESSLQASRSKIDNLESDSRAQAQQNAELSEQLEQVVRAADEVKEKLRKEESLRRKLHNQVQELKGNIRVFCRVRPSIEADAEEPAKIVFPDSEKESREIEVLGPEEKSSLGTVSTKRNAFAFDRVFSHSSTNEDIFEELSQLVQSALDGYNVCIFCYGQTGSGKTYTMSADDGMIPRALHQIYHTAQSLEDKGWRYTMEGSFVEVYNENLNDLLGRPEDFDKKKLEIRHDAQRSKTHVSDLTAVTLDSPAKVESILRQASANRSVAATKANERSSRSHSVFILRLTGENATTGERSEGTLNLVDLAGSERLSQSHSTGDRLKETQNINRSLSCLGDVIGALGQGKEGGHVPYRNSKLTYLLQYSLGGNSKTLMFVMISPLQAHLSETLTSLKFATKVHNTHIGTAKRQARIKES